MQIIRQVSDFYQILGINRDASPMCIRKAFREKAKKMHPDLNPGANPGAFHSINEAYQVLSNPTLRHMYDLRLRNGTYTYYRVYYRPGNVAKPHEYSHAAHARNKTRYEDTVEKVLNHFLFLSLISVGLFAAGFGVYLLFYGPEDGVNPMLGIVFGTVFTVLLGYGYRKYSRS